MRVRDLMRQIPRHTMPAESLASAGRTMAEAGVGVLPVIDVNRRVVGVLTDRDVCCALAREDRRPSELCVGEVATSPAHICQAGDDLSTALATMRVHAVRRLPVVDVNGRLDGLLSLDEVVVATHVVAGDDLGGPAYAEVVSTLQAILHPANQLVELRAVVAT